MTCASMSLALRIAARSLARQQRLAPRRCVASQSLSAAAQLHRLSLVATSPSATHLLAGYFASELHAADCYLLYGSVGSGKSYFCRQFIRAACGDDDLPVPSPTFLLQNIYEQPPGQPPIHHFDLYRLTAPHDLLRLDLPSSMARAVSLIEWAERLEGQGLPEDHLAIQLQVLHEDEQAALQQRGVQPALHQQPEEGEAEDLEDPDGDSGDDGGGDVRWRRIVFSSAAPRWQRRLQSLGSVLEARGPEFGCWVDR